MGGPCLNEVDSIQAKVNQDWCRLRRTYHQLIHVTCHSYFTAITWFNWTCNSHHQLSLQTFQRTSQNKGFLAWLWGKPVRCTAGAYYHFDSEEVAISSLGITVIDGLSSWPWFCDVVLFETWGCIVWSLQRKNSETTHGYEFETGGQRKLLRPLRPTSRSGVVSFSNRAPLLWNSLPEHVRASKTPQHWNPVSLPTYLRLYHIHFIQKLWHWPSATLCVRWRSTVFRSFHFTLSFFSELSSLVNVSYSGVKFAIFSFYFFYFIIIIKCCFLFSL